MTKEKTTEKTAFQLFVISSYSPKTRVQILLPTSLPYINYVAEGGDLYWKTVIGFVGFFDLPAVVY